MGALADSVGDEIEAAARQTLELVGLDLQGRSQRDAPVEEGTLRGSASHSVIETSTGAIVVVSFATPYAARQHEEITWKHPKGGRSKYLEANLKLMLAVYRDALRDSVAAAIARINLRR